jgi:hypothetical protein
LAAASAVADTEARVAAAMAVAMAAAVADTRSKGTEPPIRSHPARCPPARQTPPGKRRR